MALLLKERKIGICLDVIYDIIGIKQVKTIKSYENQS